ncbi:MAG: glycerophosphodiester phosphodiesterase family protein [Candidatus Puniceispirillaceae bacterium]|jgi:glycerophosphoryl diester phosphodiesterase
MKPPQVAAFSGDSNTIRVVGHRGARGILPENSIVGFDFALSIGVDLLEFDVLLTADDVPVITHNHELHGSAVRGPDGAFLNGERPRVASLQMEEIARFDIGRLDGATDYGRRFPDQAQMDGIRVPRLSELLRLVSQPKYETACLMLELKSDPEFAHDSRVRERIVSTVSSEVRAAGLADRTLLHSFDWALLAECRRQAPDIPISFLTQLQESEDDVGEDSSILVVPDLNRPDISVPDEVSRAGGSLWCPHFSELTAADLARARELGLCVAVWTVNEPGDIDAMIDLGVDAIVTDYPGRVQRRLSDRGYRWAR